jgi:hypothetical protein
MRLKLDAYRRVDSATKVCEQFSWSTPIKGVINVITIDSPYEQGGLDFFGTYLE